MAGEAQLMLLIAGVHVVGLACVAILLIPALREPPEDRSDSDSDDGGGSGPRRPPAPPEPPRGGIPLPDARPARVRLREHGRLSDRQPRRQRRHSREPVRQPLQPR